MFNNMFIFQNIAAFDSSTLFTCNGRLSFLIKHFIVPFGISFFTQRKWSVDTFHALLKAWQPLATRQYLLYSCLLELNISGYSFTNFLIGHYLRFVLGYNIPEIVWLKSFLGGSFVQADMDNARVLYHWRERLTCLFVSFYFVVLFFILFYFVF